MNQLEWIIGLGLRSYTIIDMAERLILWDLDSNRVSKIFRESLREWLQPIEAKLNLIMN